MARSQEEQKAQRARGDGNSPKRTSSRACSSRISSRERSARQARSRTRCTTLVTQALADSTVVKDQVLDTIEEMIARLDEKLTAQMNEMLHAPEFQQWKAPGAALLSRFQLRDGRDAQDPRPERLQGGALSASQELYPGARWDQSPLFKAVYESEFGTFGGEPYGAPDRRL